MNATLSLSKEENKSFYKKTFALVMPMAIQNLINVGVTAADTVMLGRIDESAISAVSLANQILFILVLIVFGITSGASILNSQYWGKQNIKAIENVLAISIDISLIVSAIFTIGAIFIPKTLMSIYSHDPTVISLGSTYMRIVCVTYIISTVTTIYFNTLRSMERVVISTVVYGISLLINISVNAVLIFGLFGLPRLGVVGAAIGTICARVFELIVVIYLSNKKNSYLKIIPKYMLHVDRLMLKDFIKYSTPVIINEMLWGVAISANSAIIGQISTSAAAANAIAMVTKQLAQVISLGVAMATAVMLGKMIGEGEKQRVKIYAKKYLKLSFVLASISCILILLLKDLPIKYMKLTPEANMYLSHMLVVLAFIFVCQAVNTTMIVGVFRAGGDSKTGLIIDVSSMWLFSIPAGLIAGFILYLDVRIVYILLLFDEVIKVPMCLIRYKSNKWIKDVTRQTI